MIPSARSAADITVARGLVAKKVLHVLGGLRELVEVNGGVADARTVVAAQPHGDAGKILEAELGEFAARHLAHIDHHLVLSGGLRPSQQHCCKHGGDQF
nr:hypothetical protein [Bradyrhizobium lablabi]